MKRQVPRLKTDEEAEAFLAWDLSDLDFPQFRPARFELEPGAAHLNMRLARPLLDAVKARARDRGIPYTRFVHKALERGGEERPLSGLHRHCTIKVICPRASYHRGGTQRAGHATFDVSRRRIQLSAKRGSGHGRVLQIHLICKKSYAGE